jgi:hypothetical protein
MSRTTRAAQSEDNPKATSGLLLEQLPSARINEASAS